MDEAQRTACIDACEDLTGLVGLMTEVSDASARGFLSLYPPRLLVDVMQSAAAGSRDEAAVASALSSTMATASGAEHLPGLLPFAALGLGAASAVARKLSCRLLGLLAALPDGVPQIEASGALGPLAQALGDSDAGVGLAAGEALKAVAGTADGRGLSLVLGPDGPCVGPLSACTTNEDAVVRTRALALAGGLAGMSSAAAAAVEGAGLLAGLAQGLADTTDLLSCMATMDLIAEIVETPGAAAGLLGSASEESPLVTAIAELLRPTTDSLLRAQALKVAARMVAARVELNGGVTHPTTASWISAIAAAVGPAEEDPSVVEAAAQAFGDVGLGLAGAIALLEREPGSVTSLAALALGPKAKAPMRLTAAHALASAAGAERAVSAPGADLAGSPAAAEALRDGVFGGSAPSTPAEALLRWLTGAPGDTFVEERVAAYRLVCGLARHRWFAAEACAHAGFLARLCDARADTGQRACEWRYSAVGALAHAARAAEADTPADAANGHSPLLAARATLDNAVAAGIYGERGATAAPQIATQNR